VSADDSHPAAHPTGLPEPPPSGTTAGMWSRMRVDISPLRASRDFRLLLSAGAITMLGSYVTYVAVPVQIKELTGSYLAVGLVAAVEFVPMVIFGLYGGALADAVDRKRMVVLCELGMLVASAGLLVNALLPKPALWPLYVIAAVVATLDSMQRPSLDGLMPRYVPHRMLTAASALSALRWSLGEVLGPVLGGLIIVAGGVAWAYAVDVATFGLSFLLLVRMRRSPAPSEAASPGLRSILEGLRYAAGRKDLLGTYLVDIVAMLLAMPVALYPFLADELDAPWALGLLYSSGAVGSLIASGTSGWTSHVHRHGIAITLAAGTWGAAIGLAGLALGMGASALPVVLVCLTVAGAADMISGVFRDTVWNQSIPDHLRGRLAGIELLSYSTGPMLGNARAGLMAQLAGTRFSIGVGGLLCVGAVTLTAALAPTFRRYDARTDEHVLAEQARRAAASA
jgi:MFS family permease